MSSLLEQAIVDAKALKEAAMKNAEATIIDKYSDEVKSTLNQLLEQDELEAALGIGGDELTSDAEATMDEEVEKDEIAEGVPDAFTEDIAELGGVNEGEESEITIDFKELAEALNELREGIEADPLEEAEEETLEEAEEEPVDEELQLDEESIVEMVAAMLSEEDEETLEEAEEEGEVVEEGEDEDLYEELSDDLLDAIMEKLTVDMGATLGGWAGRSEEAVKHQMELEMAHRRSTEVAEELEALKKAQ